MTPAAREFYCDRLSWRTLPALIHRSRGLNGSAAVTLRVLDPIPQGWRGTLCRRVLALFRITACEESFFAGYLRFPDGLPVQRAAAELSAEAALAESTRLVASSAILSRLNTDWERETVRLHLCKCIQFGSGLVTSVYGYALRLQAARALAVRDGRDPVLLAEYPAVFSIECLTERTPDLRVICYGSFAAHISSKWQLIRQALRGRARWAAGAWLGLRRSERRRALQAQAAEGPGLLLLQEDDLSLDRSRRGQPHWLLPEDPPTAFQTWVLATSGISRLPADIEALRRAHVFPLSDSDLLLLAAGRRSKIDERLRRERSNCLAAGLRSGSASETWACGMLLRLQQIGWELACAFDQLQIRTTMTSESYLPAADAIALIGDAVGVHTAAYQYSNLGTVSPLMLTTVDLMLTFSPLYQPHWRCGTIHPRAFVDVGYSFDAAFARLAPRAQDAKEQLRSSGAAFVIAYFDENAVLDKYGLTNVDDHCAELRLLFELVLADPTIGLVTKVQFQRNSPSRLAALSDLVARAQATGRYLELVHGAHRNNVYPAEAARVADLAIGHAIGGAAPLEAALAGTRTIILNPYGMRDSNHDVYRRADVLLHSLEAAVPAIADFRAGTRPGLGDWAPIVADFDAFRDGRAGHRIRAVLDCLMTPEHRKGAASDLMDNVRAAVARAS